MAISNALPIQFWETGTETFNELDVCGITAICFCQPVQCDDPLTFQFLGSGHTYSLVTFDEDGAVLDTAPFTVPASGTYQVTIIPEDEEICDEVVQFKILSESDYVLAPAAGWAKINSGTGLLSYAGSTMIASINTVAFDASSAQAFTGIDLENFSDFTINIDVTGGAMSGIISVNIFVFDEEGNGKSATVSFTNFGTASLTLDADDSTVSSVTHFNKLVIQVTGNLFTGGAAVTITLPVGAPFSSTYQSDCIDVRTEHECTKLITYSNNSDFAGIDYNAQSPSPEFNLRVPAMLFRATRPEEQEVHPLSNDQWIRVWSRMTKKMKLELGYMPDYMHEKLQLIFMHDNVEIDGLSWKKRDPYELIEGNPDNPLMKANVLLTDKTFIKRNLI